MPVSRSSSVFLLRISLVQSKLGFCSICTTASRPRRTLRQRALPPANQPSLAAASAALLARRTRRASWCGVQRVIGQRKKNQQIKQQENSSRVELRGRVARVLDRGLTRQAVGRRNRRERACNATMTTVHDHCHSTRFRHWCAETILPRNRVNFVYLKPPREDT